MNHAFILWLSSGLLLSAFTPSALIHSRNQLTNENLKQEHGRKCKRPPPPNIVKAFFLRFPAYKSSSFALPEIPT